LSTIEAEYMTTTHGSKEAVWFIWFMKISCDNESEIFLAKNPTYHSNTKHIDVQYHFVRDMVERNKVLLEKVGMLENITDSLTKSVSVVLLVQRGNGHYCPGSVNESSEISRFQQRIQQVGQCWVVIFFVVKF
jgi:hypothetical protein